MEYRKLRFWAAILLLWAKIGSVLCFLVTPLLFAEAMSINDSAEFFATLIVSIPLGFILALIHYYSVGAVSNLISLLIRLERNTRGIKDLNDTLKQMIVQPKVQQLPVQQSPTRPTLNVPKK